MTADQPKTFEAFWDALPETIPHRTEDQMRMAWDAGHQAAIHRAADYLHGCGEPDLAERLRNTYSKQAPGNE